jgi:hypothetical protein
MLLKHVLLTYQGTHINLMLRLFRRKMVSVESIFRCLARTENRKYFFIFLFNHINL